MSQASFSAEIEPFGCLPDGRTVERVSLSNALGMEVELLTYGAMLHRIRVPDAEGVLADVALFCETLEDYVSQKAYVGATIGRYANRIAGSGFELDGEYIALEPNEEGHQLHGGPEGFNCRVWDVEAGVDEKGAFARFQLVSEDGDQGFPGNLDVAVTYRLGSENTLGLSFEAVPDKNTVVNLTNHVYLNLSGDVFSGLKDHQVTIYSQQITNVDAQCIPDGSIVYVQDSVLDLSHGQMVAEVLDEMPELLRPTKGYDHNYVFADYGVLSRRARVTHQQSRRVLEVHASHPGMQFYTANHLRWGDVKGAGDRFYEDFGAFCLEPQHYPNSPNMPEFPSPVVKAQEKYRQTVEYRFYTDEF